MRDRKREKREEALVLYRQAHRIAIHMGKSDRLAAIYIVDHLQTNIRPLVGKSPLRVKEAQLQRPKHDLSGMTLGSTSIRKEASEHHSVSHTPHPKDPNQSFSAYRDILFILQDTSVIEISDHPHV
jgi:hypothetical protein